LAYFSIFCEIPLIIAKKRDTVGRDRSKPGGNEEWGGV
jgi:hypothetical protein